MPLNFEILQFEFSVFNSTSYISKEKLNRGEPYTKETLQCSTSLHRPYHFLQSG